MSDTSPGRRPVPSSPAATGAGGGSRGRRRGQSTWRRTFLEVSIAIGILALVQGLVVKAYQIPSASMEDTLMTGDRILVNRLDDSVERGDVIVFEHGDTWESSRRSPSDSTVVNALRWVGTIVGLGPSTRAYTVKRVIATGGETVACCTEQGEVTVDGVALDEDYLGSNLPFEPGETDCTTTPRSVRCFPEITVPGGSLFMLGDNRANSADSVVACRSRDDDGGCARFVRLDQVVGPVVARFWPPTSIGGIDP
ncbi:MAG: signal peptidase I [Dermatophilaceae bacterium]